MWGPAGCTAAGRRHCRHCLLLAPQVLTASPNPTCLNLPCSARRAVATMALQFWAAPVCPYAQRGWIALKETGALLGGWWPTSYSPCCSRP